MLRKLTDAEVKDVAVNLLGKCELEEFERIISEREHDCARNGFWNVPIECEDWECNECPITNDVALRDRLGCPYVED